MTSRIPAPNSITIVITRSTCAIGRPLEAIIAAVWSKPPILLQPGMMKMKARRMRPTRPAALSMIRFIVSFSSSTQRPTTTHRPPTPVGGSDEAPRTAPRGLVESLLFVARRDSANARFDPDLQEMDRVALGGVVFAVGDAGPRAHALHVAGPDDRAIAHRIAVREPALEHVSDDLHVAMAVG